MNATRRLLGVLGLALFCPGCMMTRTYVDPQFRDATYQSIRSATEPRLVTISVEFQVNGKHSKQQDDVVRRKVTRVLTATRAFAETGSARTAQAGQLRVVVNNVGNLGAAAGKGALTGLTYGLVGSHVVDGYVMTAAYTPASGSPVSKTYKHAIHTTIGVHAVLKDMEPVPPGDAFDQVVEDMLLNFLRDLQREGRL